MARVQSCEVISLDRVYELCFELAGTIRESGFIPDLMVAVARGGFVPARLLCDFLQHRELASLAVVHYAAGGVREQDALLTHPLAADVRGRRVLVVDDVNDSGRTLELVKPHLEGLGALETRFAVIHEKEESIFRADYRARRPSSDVWIVYQWALVEDVIGFVTQMQPEPRAFEEVRRRLEEDFGLAIDAGTWEKVSLGLDRDDPLRTVASA